MNLQPPDSDATRIEAVVQRQLEAYNRRDIEALMATYADDAKQFEFPSKLMTSGTAEIRQRFLARFEEPNLHASLQHRVVLGNTVIDHEIITRTFPEGTGTLEIAAIYEVRNERIASAWFIPGEKKLNSPRPQGVC